MCGLNKQQQLWLGEIIIIQETELFISEVKCLWFINSVLNFNLYNLYKDSCQKKKTVDKSDLALKSLFPNPALLNTVQLEAFWLAACQQGCSGTMCVTFSDCHWNYCGVGDLGREE